MQKCQRFWGCPQRGMFGLGTVSSMFSFPPWTDRWGIMNKQNGKKRQTTQILSHDPVRGRAPDPGGAGGGQDT